jgi:hypothetical protein
MAMDGARDMSRRMICHRSEFCENIPPPPGCASSDPYTPRNDLPDAKAKKKTLIVYRRTKVKKAVDAPFAITNPDSFVSFLIFCLR